MQHNRATLTSENVKQLKVSEQALQKFKSSLKQLFSLPSMFFLSWIFCQTSSGNNRSPKEFPCLVIGRSRVKFSVDQKIFFPFFPFAFQLLQRQNHPQYGPFLVLKILVEPNFFSPVFVLFSSVQLINIYIIFKNYCPLQNYVGHFGGRAGRKRYIASKFIHSAQKVTSEFIY